MSTQRGLRPALAGLACAVALIGWLFASVAAQAASTDDPLAARRTPTPSDTPQPTATALPEATPTPAPVAEVTPTPAAEPEVLFNDLANLVISRYPDGSLSFWRAHPERGDWGFVAWLDITAQYPGGHLRPGAPAGALIVDVADEGWRLTVQRIDDCGGPSPKAPTDSAEWHLYAARVVARMMCDGRPMYYLWLTNAAGQRVTEGAFVP